MILDNVLHVSTPFMKSLLVDFVLKSCDIMVENLELLVDLILLDMEDFDVILGID